MSCRGEKEKEKEEIGIQVARSVLYRAHLARNGTISCHRGQKEAGVAAKYRTAYPHLRLDPSHECNTYRDRERFRIRST